MQRYFINQPADGQELALPKDVAHHLVTVLRATVGSQVELVLADHRVYLATVTATNPAQVKIVQDLDRDSELPLRVTLVCGLPKTKEKPELIVQKATELGADRIVFFESARSISHWAKNKQAKKLARLQKIADGAAEQSHRNRQPQVAYYPDLESALAANPADQRVVAWEESAKQGETSALHRLLVGMTTGQSLLAVFGPEGGLTGQEVERMQEVGVVPVGLGPRILRTETAPLYFMAAVSYASELATTQR
ncbi:16S rRNA (uracil(1498)-N(3))-methyltransferase [Limosilactobacillus pontis]|uniref:Ribosomal RNA small subunit methyltransferase E n=1 Tax=Limosilactobacillus pontis DSM 8475 TaxID=1423794 RepID=A0A922PTN4_9LACO|nr:16S rRNA (uracil(1498)-N(3))-methyltransferase [Limosilactobacillus pontis]KRM35318.1 RNA methyltransferase, RsmE family [Limosilactobacillus pontis DSM 8475]QFV00868.1 16S rRNA (uracil(1498)-N(3))-methyltransferase [Limosilactobacillus pontis]